MFCWHGHGHGHATHGHGTGASASTSAFDQRRGHIAEVATFYHSNAFSLTASHGLHRRKYQTADL